MTSLRRYLWALALIPSLLAALLLSGWYSHQQLQITRDQLSFEANTLASILIPQLYNQFQQEPQTMENSALLASLANQPNVHAAALRNTQGQIIAQIGPRLPGLDKSLLENPTLTRETLQENRLRLISPILLSPQSESSAPVYGWLDLQMSAMPFTLAYYQIGIACVLIFFLAFLFSLAMGWHLTNTTLKPLQQIQQLMALITEGNRPTVATPLLRFDQHQVLINALIQMGTQLHLIYQDLQEHANQANQDLRQTLETIEIQNIELDIARKEALQASQIKSEFLANMSHEIRTPLNGVIGFCKLLMKTATEPRQHEYLTTIAKCSESLLKIINDILDFSKIESGKLVLEQVAFNLADLVEEVLTMLSPQAHEKNLELTHIFYIDTQRLHKGDPLRIKQVLTNLVNNAIKFTDKGSVSVRVMCEAKASRGDLIKITITDTGIGLPANSERLFTPFSQGDSSSARQYGGTGLGLVISRHLVKNMQGDMGYQSEPQQGTTFWFTLCLPATSDNSAQHPAEGLRQRSILICDDDPLTRLSLKALLQPLDIQITELNHVTKLLTTIEASYSQAKPFDAMIISSQNLGLNQPILSNQSFITTLNHIEKEYGIRCLLMANTQELHYWQAYEGLDIAHCIAKPICRARLFSSLSELILDDTNPISLPFQPQRLNLPAGRIEGQARVESCALCVDDNITNLRLLEAMLQELGLRVISVTSGSAALACLAENSQQISAIFMDIHMPNLDGITTTLHLRALYQQKNRKPPPVFAVTAHALISEQENLLAQGFDDILIKPIQENELEHLLRQLGLCAPASAIYSQQEKTIKTQLTQALINELDKTLFEIKNAWEQDDLAQLLTLVHQLHGGVSYCDLPLLKASVNHLETLLKNGPSQTLPTAMRDLCTQIEVLIHWREQRIDPVKSKQPV